MISAQLDTTQFNAALKNYMRATEKEISQVLNSKAFFIAKRALAYTPKADRAKILELVGAYQVMVTGKRSKKTKIITEFAKDHDSTAVKLMRWKAWMQGKKQVTRAQESQAAKRFINRRLSAVGSLKSGWVRAIAILASKINQPTNLERLPRVKQASKAKPAEPSWDPEVSFEYRFNSQGQDGQFYLDPRVTDALQKAMDDEAKSMEEYAAKKLQAVADKYAGR